MDYETPYLSDSERSVLLAELLRRHPELAAEADEITAELFVVDDWKVSAEVTARLRALRASGPVSVDAGQRQALAVLQPYLDDLTRRREIGAWQAAADIAIALLLGIYECREDAGEDMLLVRMGLPAAADDLARTVHRQVMPLRAFLPSLADECPEWTWYEEELV